MMYTNQFQKPDLLLCNIVIEKELGELFYSQVSIVLSFMAQNACLDRTRNPKYDAHLGRNKIFQHFRAKCKFKNYVF